MPTYMLDGHSEVGLSVRPLTLTLRLEGIAKGARLEATSPDGPVDSVRPRPDLLILPRIDGRITVRVVPIDGRLFPSPTVAHIDIAVDNPGVPDPERAVLGAVSLDALSSRDLLAIEHVGDSLRVRAAQVEGPEVELGPVGDAARVAATEVLGVRAVDPISALNVVVAVDSSASMTALREDGTVDTVVQVLAGLAAVITPGMSVGGALVGSSTTRLAAADVGVLVSTLAAAQNSRTPSSGLRSGAPDLSGFSLTGNTVTYLITDAVPADVASFEAAHEIDGEARHLIVVGSPAAWALQTPPSTPATSVAVDNSGIRLHERLLGDPVELRKLVTSLMVGCFAPGTGAHERSER